MAQHIVPIIIQTFNRLPYSIEVLGALTNHLIYPTKIIVIDNGSTDGTIEYLQLMLKLGFIHQLILNNENKGIAEPKNQGLEIVKELEKEFDIKYICITDNDIVVPFMRKGGCVLTQIVNIMEKNEHLGMVGVDLNRDNAPDNQDYWWKLRQHLASIPQFAEIVMGFWFTVFRYDVFKEGFRFKGGSLYGRVDESIRNFLGLQKKRKIGLIKGIEITENGKHKETEPRLGIHLGWTEDLEKFSDYVNFKKAERYKAEQVWKEEKRQW